MLDNVFASLLTQPSSFQERTEGAAFLRSIAQLYGARSVDYIAADVLNKARSQWISCHYSSAAVRQAMTGSPTRRDVFTLLGLPEGQSCWRPGACLGEEAAHSSEGDEFPSPLADRVWMLALPKSSDETAIFCVSFGGEKQPDAKLEALAQEWTSLANYFHSHILRLNGHDASSRMLVSARELDCLRWTAAGKTAWEASRILGISERTVRFHLNAAREKLNCATTTQAVAKAVASRMIQV